MGYTLQALVGRSSGLRATCGDLPVLALAQDVLMIPLTTAVRLACGEIPFLPLTDEGSDTIPQPLKDLCGRLSADGRLAYVEAEFFGGDGTQAMFLAEHGSVGVGQRSAPTRSTRPYRRSEYVRTAITMSSMRSSSVVTVTRT